MSRARLEREARFALPDVSHLAAVPLRLQELGVRLGRARSVLYEDVYLDTPDARLWRAGVGFRVRHMGGRTVATLKTGRIAADLAERLEWSETVREWCYRPGLAPVPGTKLRRILREAGLALRMRPLARLTVSRTTWTARWPQGHTVTVCADDVCARVGVRRVRFAEVEIESPPDAATAERAIESLRALTPWRPLRVSKLERACRAAGRRLPEPPAKRPLELPPNATTAEMARRVLAAYWAHYQWNRPGAAAGFDPEFLHDLRVAIRRMRATASALESVLTPSLTAWLKDLKSVARAAGRVRDLDIVLAWSREPAARESALVAPAARGQMTALLARERQRRLRRLRRLLHDPAQERWNRRLPALLQTIRSDSSECARALIRAQANAARKAARAAARRISADTPLEEFHELRIRCKTLRYRLELLRHFGDPAVRKAISRLAGLQDELGRLQDLATVRHELMALRPAAGHPQLSSLLREWRTLLDRQIDEQRRRAWKRLRNVCWRELRP
ncbi:MAG: CHAD domain-containing protein [Kiritimatiellae bacterium]|nr:CHAD domain-containing protein [Kiritimatiellia bacterium]